MSDSADLDRVVHLMELVREQTAVADSHRIVQLVRELDMLAEELVGRYDGRVILLKAQVQELVLELAPTRRVE